MYITINSGTTFLTCDTLGNIPEDTELGLYHEDARFLSRYVVTLDGKRLLPLAATATDPSAAVFYATNPVLKGARQGTLSVIRRRALREGLHEDIEITNYGDSAASCELQVALDSDFAHLFEVKRMLAADRPVRRVRSIRIGRMSTTAIKEDLRLTLHDGGGRSRRRMALRLSPAPSRARTGCFRFALTLAPRASWRLTLDVLPQIDATTVRDSLTANPATGERPDVTLAGASDELACGAFPALQTDSIPLAQAYAQSVRDFTALRIRDDRLVQPGEYAVAAGIPWYMTLFGRDSLLAAYQALAFAPDAARGTLRALARLQGTVHDAERGEDPGKILHEHRHEHYTEARRRYFPFPYDGTVDATPLFLMLLAAYYSVTDDATFIHELRENALAALDWMERAGDRDGDGYLEYAKDTERGLANQGWKDSWDAIRFADGRLAAPPIALCEAQGYAYAAYMGMSLVFAALGESERAMSLRTRAAELKARFNHDFWMPERGYYALALDGAKRQVDAITSNAGHLLWTGIADEEKARLVADALLAPPLFSGWGIRTMAASEGGYNPISYHCGSVWPHDNSLIVAGLLRYGFVEAAQRVTESLLQALTHFADRRLPELFAGFSVDEAPVPVEYFAANRPQAWATATVFLLLSAMTATLPLPDGMLGAQLPPLLPEGVTYVALEGVWRQGMRARVRVRRHGEHHALLERDDESVMERSDARADAPGVA